MDTRHAVIQVKLPRANFAGSKGFALVVTLALMILLTVIAVGLLSLSAISLRSSSQAVAQAQANARLALMLAIGELQKNTGTDTRITAPSSIVDPNSPPLTGSWKSWEGSDHDNQGRPTVPDYAAKKSSGSNSGRFLMWLVSGAELGNAPANPASLVSKTPGTGTVPLLSSGTLGAGNDRQVHLVPQRVSLGSNSSGKPQNATFA